MQKKFYNLIFILVLVLGIDGCPNNPNEPPTTTNDSNKIASLQTKINNASDGDTINFSGTVSDSGTLNINKAVTISGGNFNGSTLNVSKDGVSLQNVSNVSVTTNNSMKISGSSLSGLIIGSSSSSSNMIISRSETQTQTVSVSVEVSNSETTNIQVKAANASLSLDNTKSENVEIASSAAGTTLTVSGEKTEIKAIEANAKTQIVQEGPIKQLPQTTGSGKVSTITMTADDKPTEIIVKGMPTTLYTDQKPTFDGVSIIGSYSKTDSNEDEVTILKPIKNYTIKVGNTIYYENGKTVKSDTLSANTYTVTIIADGKTKTETLTVKSRENSGNNNSGNNNGGNNNSGEEKEEPTPSTTSKSGLTKNAIVQITLGVTYNVSLNSTEATFSATILEQTGTQSQSSSLDNFEGNFFYYSNVLRLEIIKMNGKLSEKYYFSVSVSEEQLYAEIPTLIPYVSSIAAEVYEQEKVAFERIKSGTTKPTKTVTSSSLSGSKWICRHSLYWMIYPTNNISMEYDTGCVKMEFSDTTVDIGIGILTYTINGSTVIAEREDSTITITFYQDDTAELFVNTTYEGKSTQTFRAIFQPATDSDVLTNTTYKLLDTQTEYKFVNKINFYPGVFEIYNNFGRIVGQGTYTLSGQGVSLVFSNDKSLTTEFKIGRPQDVYEVEEGADDNDVIISGTVAGTLTSNLSSLTLNGTVKTEQKESVALSQTYSQETSSTIGYSFQSIATIPAASIDSFVGTWKVVGGSYWENFSDSYEYSYFDFNEDGTYTERYKLINEETEKTINYEITENKSNIIKISITVGSVTTSFNNFTYEISGSTMTWQIYTGNEVADAIQGAFYIFEKQ